MAIAGPTGESASWSRGLILRRTLANLAEWIQALGSAQRIRPAQISPIGMGPGPLVVGITAGGAATVAAMVFLDALAIVQQRHLPGWVIAGFARVTDLGQSGWLLIPLAVLIGAIAAVSSPALRRFDRLVLAALVARLGYVFVAVGLPGLVVTILKRMIGRARPHLFETHSPFEFEPFKWDVTFASLPSGHGTTAFAAAFAIGALCPRLRVPLWWFALVIAVSRVAVSAHYPSDVVAGAVAGVLGALIVRNWFASRRFAFVRTPEGAVRALPGPSWRRIGRVLRRAVGA
ncbi:MAG: phosphatase PAP2 family protein [Variibacter sp.]|nr:phosphatase PAP2 family protein [Variibacter sp.]